MRGEREGKERERERGKQNNIMIQQVKTKGHWIRERGGIRRDGNNGT